jgi:hypothetical protein
MCQILVFNAINTIVTDMECNIHKRRGYCSSEILKYSSNSKSVLKILLLNALWGIMD